MAEEREVGGTPVRRAARRYAVGKIKKCRQCGVPLRISRDFTWNDNGTITQDRDPGNRVLFFESGFLDELFTNLESLVGRPIEPLVVESKRRSTRRFMQNNVAPVVRKVIYRYCPKAITERIITMGTCYGYGRISALELRSKEGDLDHQVISVRHPYSLALFCGDALGSKEAMEGHDFSVSREETGEHEYRLTFRAGEHPAQSGEAEERPRRPLKAGELAYKRCGACGVPLGVARCRWDLEMGVVVDPGTSRRMAIFSPASVEAVLKDLQEEVGEDIVDLIIDEQRRFVRKTIGRDEALLKRQSYRELAALRGLGNVTKIEVDGRNCTVIMENPCLTLFLVGIIQAFFEMSTEHGEVERSWEILPDGDLVVELRA